MPWRTSHSGHLLLTISDGMGAGINAMRESRVVVKLMEQLMNNGIEPEAAAGIVNAALYLRGGEECAATIDLAAVDLEGRYVDLLKVGAPPSFLKRGHSVEMIRSSCWPAGILDRVEAEVHRRQVLPGDILIMVTDGITEVEREAVPARQLAVRLSQRLAPGGRPGGGRPDPEVCLEGCRIAEQGRHDGAGGTLRSRTGINAGVLAV